jgi:valyl-tRNA synthetase
MVYTNVSDRHISYQNRITNQLHRLGGSYDWDRVAFTMNPVCTFRSPYADIPTEH